MENEAIKQARDVLENISQDEHERYLAELREKHIMDEKAIKDAGFYDGFDKGKIEGIMEGENKERLKIAKKLKDEKVEISVICNTTGLTKEEVEKL